MTARQEPGPAAQPEDLGALFLERANAGDVEGLVALYGPGAVLAFPAGRLATGHEEIRAVYAELLSGRPGSPRRAGSRRSGTETWRSPRPGCRVAGPRWRWPGGSRTAAGAGSSISRPCCPERTGQPADQGNGARSGSTQSLRAAGAASVDDR